MDEREFSERLNKPTQWVIDMRNFYNENGFYRPQDLKRLLGNPCVGVEVSIEDLRNRWLNAA